jgi:hypothetical protein
LDIHLPLDYSPVSEGTATPRRATTRNVSTGGVYFEVDHQAVQPGGLVSLHLTIPPGEGHFPYQGRISSLGVVIRVDTLSDDPQRWGVAVQFREALRLSF